MTLAELIERLQWQQEGRLERMAHLVTGGWAIVPPDANYGPIKSELANLYRRRPDQPPMPDEVWAPDYEYLRGVAGSRSTGTVYATREACVNENNSATPVRYVRAGAVIPASQLEWNTRNSPEWMPACGNEYRIKP